MLLNHAHALLSIEKILSSWSWLSKRWIELSTRQSSIQQIAYLISVILIRWIVIYLASVVQKLDSAIHRINSLSSG